MITQVQISICLANVFIDFSQTWFFILFILIRDPKMSTNWLVDMTCLSFFSSFLSLHFIEDTRLLFFFFF